MLTSHPKLFEDTALFVAFDEGGGIVKLSRFGRDWGATGSASWGGSCGAPLRSRI
jgi:hypothetical protein